MLQKKALIAKIVFDTDENGPSELWATNRPPNPFPPWYTPQTSIYACVPHDAARIRLRTGGFPRAVLKATAASQRDLSTICNIIVRSRVRFPKLPRFNVGEQDNTQDIEFDLCSWDKPRQLTMFRGPTRRRTSLYCDDQLTTPATHTQRLEPLSHFILFQQRTPAKVRDMLSSNSSTATKNV